MNSIRDKIAQVIVDDLIEQHGLVLDDAQAYRLADAILAIEHPSKRVDGVCNLPNGVDCIQGASECVKEGCDDYTPKHPATIGEVLNDR